MKRFAFVAAAASCLSLYNVGYSQAPSFLDSPTYRRAHGSYGFKLEDSEYARLCAKVDGITVEEWIAKISQNPNELARAKRLGMRMARQRAISDHAMLRAQMNQTARMNAAYQADILSQKEFFDAILIPAVLRPQAVSYVGPYR